MCIGSRSEARRTRSLSSRRANPWDSAADRSCRPPECKQAIGPAVEVRGGALLREPMRLDFADGDERFVTRFGLSLTIDTDTRTDRLVNTIRREQLRLGQERLAIATLHERDHHGIWRRDSKRGIQSLIEIVLHCSQSSRFPR